MQLYIFLQFINQRRKKEGKFEKNTKMVAILAFIEED
jgi:hypothetical protein